MRWTSLAALLVVAACLGSDFADSVEGSWQLESGTLADEPIVVQASHPVTMTLDEGRISGTAACNGYQGEYRIFGDHFEIRDGVAVTEMACTPSQVMETERRFLDALLASNTIVLEEARLVLTGPGAELIFVPQEGSEGS
ncbi:MAG: META domain-containing protein [Acidimicrobiia bacterium]